MRFKINKLNLNFAITSMVVLVSILPVLAVENNIEQPMHIESDTQSINIKDNVISFTGNVIITQGTIKINADRVVVRRLDSKRGKEVIDGYGNPATIYQIQDNEKPVKGHAFHVHYELDKNLIILTGSAYLEQLNSHITSEKITFLTKEKKMRAYSEKGRRVTTVLFPVPAAE